MIGEPTSIEGGPDKGPEPDATRSEPEFEGEEYVNQIGFREDLLRFSSLKAFGE